MKQLIDTGLAQLGLTERVPANAAAQLAQYGHLLLEKNQVMNLTAIRDEVGVAQLHMLDCAALLTCVEFHGKTLIDVGTGGGFPGLPLKILVPSLQVTLMDALQKRVDWLAQVCDQLGLSAVTPIHARAEEQIQVQGFREGFDFATARAVADLRLLCELCLPFVKVGGQFLAMKAVDCQTELDGCANAIQALGGQVAGCVDYPIPGANLSHRLVIVEKIAPTPPIYPRRWAKMQKQPL